MVFVLAAMGLWAFAERISTPVYYVNYAVALKASATHKGLATLVWNDSVRLSVEVPPVCEADGNYAATAKYVLSVGDYVLGRGSVPVDYSPLDTDALLVRLVSYGEDGAVRIGTDETVPQIDVPFNCLNPGNIYVEADQNDVLLNNIVVGELPPAEYWHSDRYTTIDEALARSTDPRAGMFEFMDHRANDADVSVGGDYRVAVLADDDGGYDIVFVSGAGSHSHLWPPLRLKGHIKRTSYVENYDLEWFSAAGIGFARECYATYDPRLDLWTMEIAPLGAQMRFRRVRR